MGKKLKREKKNGIGESRRGSKRGEERGCEQKGGVTR